MSTTQTISQQAKRILGGEFLQKGYSVPEIAAIVGVSTRAVFNRKTKIKDGGTAALIQTQYGGDKNKLSELQLEN